MKNTVQTADDLDFNQHLQAIDKMLQTNKLPERALVNFEAASGSTLVCLYPRTKEDQLLFDEIGYCSPYFEIMTTVHAGIMIALKIHLSHQLHDLLKKTNTTSKWEDLSPQQQGNFKRIGRVLFQQGELVSDLKSSQFAQYFSQNKTQASFLMASAPIEDLDEAYSEIDKIFAGLRKIFNLALAE